MKKQECRIEGCEFSNVKAVYNGVVYGVSEDTVRMLLSIIKDLTEENARLVGLLSEKK